MYVKNSSSASTTRVVQRFKQNINLTWPNGIPHLDTNEMEQYVTYG
jgi:hypothetical protein